MWDSAFDGWSRKPQSAEIALWGYSAELDRYTYLCAATARASDDWDYSFENIPVSDGVTGKKFTGYALGFPQLESYYTDSSLSEKWQHYVAISYDYPKSEKERLSMNVSLRPNAAFEGKNLTDYTVRLSWADNGNSNRSRTDVYKRQSPGGDRRHFQKYRRICKKSLIGDRDSAGNFLRFPADRCNRNV